jgi:hypothetical protein
MDLPMSEEPEAYSPLEPYYPPINSLAEKLYRFCDKLPFLVTDDRGGIRRLAYRQMQKRVYFPIQEWRQFLGRNDKAIISRVETVLRVLATEINWPNHHFLPNDPVWLVTHSCDAANLTYAIWGIQEVTNQTEGSVATCIGSSKTVGDLILCLGLNQQ